MKRALRFVRALLIASAAGCGREAVPPPAPTALESPQVRLTSGHFRVLADRAGDPVLHAVLESLEAAYPRVIADLGAAPAGEVSVEIWQDEASYFAEMQRVLGRRFDATGYVTGPSGIRLLEVPAVARNASHEFCHTVSLRVNPTLANNPRWLWESVALFENQEFVDPRTIGYMVAGRPPTLDALDADFATGRQVYEVGYLIGEFVVARTGREGLVRLIRSNGDLAAIGFASRPAFETAWAAWVRERYP